MTGLIIILLFALAAAWVFLLGVVWLLCWAAARADRHYRLASQVPPRYEGERRTTARR
jgi:hypothetical protein